MTHALSVFALHLAQTALVSVPLPFKRTLRLAFVKTHTNPGRLGRARKTQGPKFIEKSTRISEMHLIHVAMCFSPPGKLIMCWHSNQGHRDISRVLFHFLDNGSRKDKPSAGKKPVHQVHKASASFSPSRSLSPRSRREVNEKHRYTTSLVSKERPLLSS